MFALTTLWVSDAAQAQPRAPRVVGGTASPPDAYPWMAALVTRGLNAANGQYCGATLIAPRWVVTAAHCVETEAASDVDVVIGQTDLSSNTGERISASQIIVHPDYASLQVPDIALIKLSRESIRRPVSLEMPGSNLATAGTTATVVGWGLTSEDGFPSRTLREAEIPIISSASCNRAYENGVNASLEICAGLSTGGRDACQGDSGGPLFVKDSQGNRYVQAGIVSWGDGCARPGSPGVYTRVSAMINWMESHTGSLVDGSSGNGVSVPVGELTARFKMDCWAMICSFDASASEAGPSPIVEYVWELGDGTWEFGRSIKHEYRSPGEYSATLYVIDDRGEQATKTRYPNPTDINTLNELQLGGSVYDRQGSRKALLPSADGMYLPEGPAQFLLLHSLSINLNLMVQMRHPTSGIWQTIAYLDDGPKKERYRSRKIRAGVYRFKVIQHTGGGNFSLEVLHDN